PDQQLRAVAPVETSAAPQPTSLPASQRYDGLRSDETSGSDRAVSGGWPTCACLRRESLREPDAANPHVRFDEGRGSRASASLTLLLYRHPRKALYESVTRDYCGGGKG